MKSSSVQSDKTKSTFGVKIISVESAPTDKFVLKDVENRFQENGFFADSSSSSSSVANGFVSRSSSKNGFDSSKSSASFGELSLPGTTGFVGE